MSSSKLPEDRSQDATGGDVAQCLAVLVRVITYARDEAKRLNADVLAFCLEAAVEAASREQDQQKAGRCDVEGATATEQRKSAAAPVH